MPEVYLELSRPFFLIKILDKDTNDVKFVWSPNMFMDSERPENNGTVAPDTYIEDIEVKSNFEPPINLGEVKISHGVGKTPQIAIKDILNIYFGYYTLGNSQNAAYSLAYTGHIDSIKAGLNHTIIKSSSKIKKLTDLKRELTFSRIMTISDIIKKLAIDDGGLEAAPNGITDTTVSKQKGYAVSKNLSIYEHLKKLADFIDYDIYMDVFDKFNARSWSPELAPVQTSAAGDSLAMGWISERDDSESDNQKQLIHPIYFGVNVLNMELDIKKKGPSNIEITSLADTEGDEIFTINPPTGTSGGGTSTGTSEGESSEEGAEKIVLPRFTKDDADKIAQALVSRNNGGLNGSLTIIGTPQIRLGDGVKIKGHIYGKKPFSRIDTQSSEYDASYTGEEGEESSTQSGSGGETLFKINGIRHLFNDEIGFISKLNITEAALSPAAAPSGAGAAAEAGAGPEGVTSTETAFAGTAERVEIEEPLIQITNAQWDKTEARQGDTLTLTADVEGAADGMGGEIEIYEHDVDGVHDLITKFPIAVANKKVETTWDYEYHEDTDEIPTDEELEKYGLKYNPPEYFFVVRIKDAIDQSGILKFKDYVEITLKNPRGEPIADEEYILTLPDGSEITGNLDSEGYAKVEGIPPGKVTVRFPKL